MSTESGRDRIDAYFAGELSPAEAEAFREELAADPALRARLAERAEEELELAELLGRPLPVFEPPVPEAPPARPWGVLAVALAAAAAALFFGVWLAWRAPAALGSKLGEVLEGDLADRRWLYGHGEAELVAGTVLRVGNMRVEVTEPARLALQRPERRAADETGNADEEAEVGLALSSGALVLDNEARDSGMRLLTPVGVLRDLGTRFAVRVEAPRPDSSGEASPMALLTTPRALVTVAVLAGLVQFQPLSPSGSAQERAQVIDPAMGRVQLADDGSIAKPVDHEGLAFHRPLGSERWHAIGEETRFHPGAWVRTGTRGAHALRFKLGGGGVVTLGPDSQAEIVDAGRIRLVSGEARVVAGAEGRVVVAGPGETELGVEGTRWIRAERAALRTLENEPRWLSGYDEGRPTEALGALLAQVDGRDVPLRIGYHKVTVDIRDQIARTVVEQSFVNHTAHTLEGVFYFPLPADASISSFGTWIGDQLVEGEIVEKERAREIYETLLREKRDPGLLEWAGGNLFKARVWPIQGEKRVKLSYTQVLPKVGAGWSYRYPLASELTRLTPLDRLEITVSIASSERLDGVRAPNYPSRVQTAENSSRVEYSAREVVPHADFVVEVKAPERSTRFVPHVRGDDGYFLVLFDAPAAPDDAGPVPGEWIFLCDTSSSSEESRAQQLDLLEALLRGLSPTDRFQLAAFDTQTAFAFDGYREASDATREQALAFLAGRIPLGWTRLGDALEQCFERANAGTRIVYLGDGVVAGEERDPGAFLARVQRAWKGRGALHTVGLGSRRDPLVLAGLGALGGTTRSLSAEDDVQASAERLILEAAAPAVEDLSIAFEGLSVAAVHPNPLPRIPAGQQAVVVGRFDPATARPRGKVRVSGRYRGETLASELDLDLSRTDAGNDFVPRLWARRRLDHLLAQGAQARPYVLELSESFQILTPYTSFLVLETEEDRERFQVEKKMRIRDGELFFAAAREGVDAELAAAAAMESRNWRLGLRREFLLSIRDLGRGRMGGLASPAQMAWGFEAERGRYRGPGDSMPPIGLVERKLAAASGSEWMDTASLHLGDSETANAFDLPPSEQSDGLDYALDFDVEIAQGAAKPADGFFDDEVSSESGPSTRGRFASNSRRQLKQAFAGGGPGGSFRDAQRFAYTGEDTEFLLALFAQPGSATPRRELPLDWPAELRAFASTLDPAAVLGDRGLHVEVEQLLLGADELPRVPRRAELWAGPDAWWQRALAAVGDSGRIEWLLDGRRGALDTTWSLGRTRAARASDARGWDLPVPTWFEDHAAVLAGFRAEWIEAENGTWLARFTPRDGGGTIREWVVDPARSFLAERRDYLDGVLVRREVFAGAFEAAGRWWPASVEVRDREDRVSERWGLRIEEVTKEAARSAVADRLPDPSRAIVLGDLPRDAYHALDAVRRGTPSLEDRMRLVATYGGARRWEIALPHAEDLLGAVAGRVGAERLALEIALARRQRELAREIVRRAALELSSSPREGEGAAANDLFYRSSFLSAGERLESANVLRAVYERQGDDAWAAVGGEHRVELYRALQRQDEFAAELRRLAEAHPRLARVQIAWGGYLASQDRVGEGVAHLERVLAGARWAHFERVSLRTAILDMELSSRRYEAFVERLERFEREAPSEVDGYLWERYPTVLVKLGSVEKADRRVREWLARTDDRGTLAMDQLRAAVEHALGRGWGAYRNRFDERWEGPLAAFLRAALGEQRLWPLVDRIVSQREFRTTRAGEAWRIELRRRLEEEGEELELATAVRLLDWMASYPATDETGEALSKRVLRALVERYTAGRGEDPGGLLGNRVESERDAELRRAYWTRRRAIARTEDERELAARSLFEALLASRWTPAIEDELYALLPSLRSGPSFAAPEAREALDRAERARSLWRITTTGETQRVEALLAEAKDTPSLDRRALAAARKRAAVEARRAVAERLATFAATEVPAGLATWVRFELLYFRASAGTLDAGWDAEAWQLARELPAVSSAPEQPSEEEFARAERALATLAWRALLAPDANEERANALLSWLRERPVDRDRQLFDPRGWSANLLLGLDRAEDLGRLLAGYAAGEEVPKVVWSLALARVQAESGALLEAAQTLRAAEGRAPLEGSDLLLLASWQRALGAEGERRAALDRAWSALTEGELSAWLERQRQLVSRTGSEIPAELDPETPRVIAALLRKAERPENYGWTLRLLYRTTRDVRLFEGLAAGVLGHSPGGIYPYLERLHEFLHEDLQEEAAVDQLGAAIDAIRGTGISATDARALDLLELSVRLRALELGEADARHLEAARKALASLDRAGWLEGETWACAHYLQGLGKIAPRELAQGVARLFSALEAATEPGTDRCRIAFARSASLWVNEEHEAAVRVGEAALAACRESAGGRIPTTFRNELVALTDRMAETGRMLEAEALLLADLDAHDEADAERRRWTERQIFTFYRRALRENRTVSLGSGRELWQAIEARFDVALRASDDPDQVRQLVSLRAGIWQEQSGRGDADEVLVALMRFARQGLPELLDRFAYEGGQNMVSTVVSTLRALRQYQLAVMVLVERAESEPAWLARNNEDFWSQHSWVFANCRQEAGKLSDDLDARALALVLEELGADLRSQRARSRYCYSQSSYYWREHRAEYLRVAAEVLAERGEREGVVRHVAEYLLGNLDAKDAAADALEAAFRRGILSFEGRAQLARTLRTAGRPARAAEIAGELVAGRPDRMELREIWLLALHEAAREAELVAAWDATEAHFRSAPGLWTSSNMLALGRIALEAGRLEACDRVLSEGLVAFTREQPNRGVGNSVLAQAYANHARALVRLGRWDAALDAAAGAIVSWGRNENQRHEAYATLKSVIAGTEPITHVAERLDREASETGLENPLLRKALGEVLLERKRFEEAATQLGLAVQASPEDLDAQRALTSALDGAGRSAEASARLLGLARTTPHDPAPWTDLGERWRRSGEAAQAERALTSIVEADPLDATAFAALARAYEKLQDGEAALATWVTVEQIAPEDPTGRIGRARVLVLLGRHEEAKALVAEIRRTSWKPLYADALNELAAIEKQLR